MTEVRVPEARVRLLMVTCALGETLVLNVWAPSFALSCCRFCGSLACVLSSSRIQDDGQMDEVDRL